MKFINYMLIVILLSVSCAASKKDIPDGKKVKLYGLVKVESGKVYIVKNWNSRSRITFKVVGKLTSKLADNNGKFASVSGIVVEKKRWSGTINVKKIYSIDAKPDASKIKPLKFKKMKK